MGTQRAHNSGAYLPLEGEDDQKISGPEAELEIFSRSLNLGSSLKIERILWKRGWLFSQPIRSRLSLHLPSRQRRYTSWALDTTMFAVWLSREINWSENIMQHRSRQRLCLVQPPQLTQEEFYKLYPLPSYGFLISIKSSWDIILHGGVDITLIWLPNHGSYGVAWKSTTWPSSYARSGISLFV